jgi:hypothetical protein
MYLPKNIFDESKEIEDPSEILKDKLYLGSDKAAKDLERIKKLKINAIINCTHDIGNHFENLGIKYLKIEISDVATENILSKFELAHQFIDKNDRVLVHCVSGN